MKEISREEKKIRAQYEKEAAGKGMKDKVTGFAKMAYLDVILRTSIYCLIIGTLTAVLTKGIDLNWINFLIGVVVVIVMQGVMQHSVDTIMDRDPVETSSFRKFAIRTFTQKELKRIFASGFVIIVGVAAVSIFVVGHWLLIVPFIFGVICIVMYARTSIISYPSFAWANVTMGAYLLQTDFVYSWRPSVLLSGNIAVICICLFVMGFFAVGQVLYKIDDHLRNMTFNQIVAYQRANLRWMHHQSLLPLIGFICALFGHYYIAAVFAALFLIIWFSTRHSTCNNISCYNNVTRRLAGPCVKCKKKKPEIVGVPPCKTCKNFRKGKKEEEDDGFKFLNIG